MAHDHEHQGYAPEDLGETHQERESLPVIVIGTGREARVAAEAIELTGQVVYGYLRLQKDEETYAHYNEVPVLGALSDAAYQKILKNEKVDYCIAVAAKLRKPLLEQLYQLTGRLPVVVVHPHATVSDSADLAQGVLVAAATVVQPNAKIEALTYIGAGCVIDCDARIGSGATLGNGVRIGAGAIVEDLATLGDGVVVGAEVVVARGASVLPGTVVLAHVPAAASA